MSLDSDIVVSVVLIRVYHVLPLFRPTLIHPVLLLLLMVPNMAHPPTPPIRASRSAVVDPAVLIPKQSRDALQLYTHAPYRVHVYIYHCTTRYSLL